MGSRIKRTWSVHTDVTGHVAATGHEETLPLVTMWVALHDIVLGNISQESYDLAYGCAPTCPLTHGRPKKLRFYKGRGKGCSWDKSRTGKGPAGEGNQINTSRERNGRSSSKGRHSGVLCKPGS